MYLIGSIYKIPLKGIINLLIWMPWDIKRKSEKLLVIFTAVHWNILNGDVIVFLISPAWAFVYLFTSSVNKDSVCCDLLPPPIPNCR